MFLFAFILLSLIAHVCFSVIENECSALRFLLFKQGTPQPVTRQVGFYPDIADAFEKADNGHGGASCQEEGGATRKS